MKRNLFSILFLFILLVTLSAQKDDLLPTTKEVIIEYKDSLVRAQVLLKRENLKIEDYSSFYFWHNKGMIGSNMGGYTGELLQGEFLVFNNQKKLITKGFFEKGRKEGSWKKWNPNGTLLSVQNFQKGKLHGECITYNESGIIINIREFKNGKLVVKEEKERKHLFSKEEKVKSDSIPKVEDTKE